MPYNSIEKNKQRMLLVTMSCCLLLSMVAISVQHVQAQTTHQQTYQHVCASSHNAYAGALVSGQRNPMRNTGNLTRGIIRATQTLIGQLLYASIPGGRGTVLDNGIVRIDRQNPLLGGDINLQVQIDGINGMSTIATAIIPQHYLGLTNPGSAAEVQRVVRQALSASLDSLINANPFIYQVEGNASNSILQPFSMQPQSRFHYQAHVTNIKSITNPFLYAITIKNGENTQQTFSIAAGGVWNGDLWVPWVGRNSEMYKSISITDPNDGLNVQIFQDYWNPAGADAIKWVNSGGSYGRGKEIAGNNHGGGEKALQILKDGSLKMQ